MDDRLNLKEKDSQCNLKDPNIISHLHTAGICCRQNLESLMLNVNKLNANLMKKSFLLPFTLLLSMFIYGFHPSTHPDTITVLQQALKNQQLEQVFDKDEEGNIIPFQLISNNFFEADVPVFLRGEKVPVFSSETSESLDQSKKSLILQSLKISKKKSILELSYDKKEAKIKLKKHQRQWHYQSILIKNGDGSYYLDVEI